MNLVAFAKDFLKALRELVLAVLDRPNTQPHRARRNKSWTGYAQRLGLKSDPGGFGRGPSVTGSLEGFPIRLEKVTRGTGKSEAQFTRLTVFGRGKIPPDLSLGAEGFVSAALRRVGRGDVATGDERFDAATRVQGDPAAARAALDATTRDGVRLAVRRGVRLEDACLIWETPGIEYDRTLERTTRELVGLARGLSLEGTTIPARLARNVRTDPSPGVRRRSFETLIERFPEAADTAEAARAALHESSPETRVLAAEALPGDEGFETLESVTLSTEAEDDVRIRALRSLVRRADAPRAAALVRSALGASSAPLCRAAVAAAGERRLAEALPHLAAMVDAADAETRTALATALGEIGDAGGEGAALALLGSAEPLVRVAAARALGRIGGKDAVEPLLALTGGLLPFGDLRAAAADAVRAIQARLGPADRGGLALSDVLRADGALSDPSAPDGGLSLSEARRREPEAG